MLIINCYFIIPYPDVLESSSASLHMTHAHLGPWEQLSAGDLRGTQNGAPVRSREQFICISVCSYWLQQVLSYWKVIMIIKTVIKTIASYLYIFQLWSHLYSWPPPFYSLWPLEWHFFTLLKWTLCLHKLWPEEVSYASRNALSIFLCLCFMYLGNKEVSFRCTKSGA